MAQILFATDTTPGLGDLDANFTELYTLKNLATVSGSNVGLGISPSDKFNVSDGTVNFQISPVTASSATFIGNRSNHSLAFNINNTEYARLTTTGFGVGITPVVRFHAYGSGATSRFRAQSSDVSGVTVEMLSDGSTCGTLSVNSNHYLTINTNSAERVRVEAAGVVRPGADNTQTLGSASFRWSTVYAGTGSINTSDAREKTAVTPMTAAELSAAKDIAREIGTFKFLAAVSEKGDAARKHAGLTVQRAIQIMQGYGLDPFSYGFICLDAWPESINPARFDEIEIPAQGGNPPRKEKVEVSPRRVFPAGDRYAFRTDELLLFIARGLEARITALEA